MYFTAATSEPNYFFVWLRLWNCSRGHRQWLTLSQEAPLSYLQMICYLESQGKDTDCLLFESGLLFRTSLDVFQRLACDVAFSSLNLQGLHDRMLIVARSAFPKATQVELKNPFHIRSQMLWLGPCTIACNYREDKIEFVSIKPLYHLVLIPLPFQGAEISLKRRLM